MKTQSGSSLKSRERDLRRRVLTVGPLTSFLITLALEESLLPRSWLVFSLTFFILLIMITFGSFFYQKSAMHCYNCSEDWVVAERQKLVKRSYRKAIGSLFIVAITDFIVKYSCESCLYSRKKHSTHYRLIIRGIND